MGKAKKQITLADVKAVIVAQFKASHAKDLAGIAKAKKIEQLYDFDLNGKTNLIINKFEKQEDCE